MGRCRGHKNKEHKQFNRKTWLEKHPEDIVIDRENQAARIHGYENDDVRRLFAAIAMQTCMDYKDALKTDSKFTEEYRMDEQRDCMKAFGEEHFQTLLGGISPEQIARSIRDVPESKLRNLMYVYNNGYSKRPRKGSAKNATAIIEE